MAASMRSSNWPERPTKGTPCRSSSAPGASPTSITRPAGLPSAKHRLLAVALRAQPSNAARSVCNSSRLAADRASNRAERGHLVGRTGGGGRREDGRGRPLGGSLGPRLLEPVARSLVQRGIDAHFGIPLHEGSGRDARIGQRWLHAHHLTARARRCESPGAELRESAPLPSVRPACGHPGGGPYEKPRKMVRSGGRS